MNVGHGAYDNVFNLISHQEGFSAQRNLLPLNVFSHFTCCIKRIISKPASDASIEQMYGTKRISPKAADPPLSLPTYMSVLEA